MDSFVPWLLLEEAESSWLANSLPPTEPLSASATGFLLSFEEIIVFSEVVEAISSLWVSVELLCFPFSDCPEEAVLGFLDIDFSIPAGRSVNPVMVSVILPMTAVAAPVIGSRGPRAVSYSLERYL